MRGVLTDYGVGKMRFQLSDFTSIYSVHTWLISEWLQCSNSLVIMVLSLPFLVILISENLTLGFYMSQGLGQIILEVSVCCPRELVFRLLKQRG